MDFKELNDKERKYYAQDFSDGAELILRIRESLATGNPLSLDGLNLSSILDYKKDYIYLIIFQEFTPCIRYGSRYENLELALNSIIKNLRQKGKFASFDIENPNKTRIMIEWIVDKKPADPKKFHSMSNFDDNRFEVGVNGISVTYNGLFYNFLPTESIIQNTMPYQSALLKLAQRMGIKRDDPKATDEEKVAAMRTLEGAKYFITKSHAFISYGKDAVPLYRGNILYKSFSYPVLERIFLNGADWLCNNVKDDGSFVYYYNCTADDNIDHEHPTRKPPNLYYNDLRHSGGTITFLRAFEHTGDTKYLDFARRTLKWSAEHTQFDKDAGGFETAYIYYNKKVKLGGVGIPLIAMMRYRMDTKDESYDRYIEGYVRHICSRLTEDGEFLGYYIHPSYNDGKPLITMTEKERKETFSFYYPGEVLLGLAMVINHYEKNPGLVEYALGKAKLAMHWIINERPKYYKDLFTALPSDAWLMQAVEEFAYSKDSFLEDEAIDFVFNDAMTMVRKTYLRDDSPYIDYEGGMYYNYGDHYYPDGARCEGLVAAYFLAKHLKKDKLAARFLIACKKAAHCQFQLSINKVTNYSHKNPEKTSGSIKFKATRQWVRVDSIQHVACFFARLWRAENEIKTDLK